MRSAALAAVMVLPLAALGCGGGDGERPAGTATAPPPAATTGSGPPTATTGEPPGARRGPPPGSRVYTCEGRELRSQPASGPVEVRPEIVRPGQQFTVRVTKPGAREILVSLTGVSDEPVAKLGRASGVTLTMPAGASCGNKLLTIEGDVSAQASVAVRR